MGEAAGAGWLSLHGIATSWGLVLHEAEAEWAATVLVSGKLRDSSLGVLNSVEANNSGSTGAPIWLVLNLSLLDLADSGEELDKVLVAGGPWKLEDESVLCPYCNRKWWQHTLRT